MSNPTAPLTAAAIADPSRRVNRLTIPLTDQQAELVTATARRLGWSKATFAREAVFKLAAAIETNPALNDPTSPLISFVPLDDLAHRR